MVFFALKQRLQKSPYNLNIVPVIVLPLKCIQTTILIIYHPVSKHNCNENRHWSVFVLWTSS